VVSNLRFVVKVAHQYKGYGMRLLDLIQEGNIGLMHAVKKFDPDKGYRLISYAVWWIRAHIQSFIMRSWSLVKLGSGRTRRKLFFKARSERSKLEQERAGDDTHDDDGELARRLGVSEGDLQEMEVRMAGHDFSLDAPVGADNTLTHLELLPEHEQQEDQLLAKERQQLLAGSIEAAKAGLDAKERYVLEKRLLADDPPTLAEVGQEFGVTRERIRQIEQKVIHKLRATLGPSLAQGS